MNQMERRDARAQLVQFAADGDRLDTAFIDETRALILRGYREQMEAVAVWLDVVSMSDLPEPSPETDAFRASITSWIDQRAIVDLSEKACDAADAAAGAAQADLDALPGYYLPLLHLPNPFAQAETKARGRELEGVLAVAQEAARAAGRACSTCTQDARSACHAAIEACLAAPFAAHLGADLSNCLFGIRQASKQALSICCQQYLSDSADWLQHGEGALKALRAAHEQMDRRDGLW